MKKRWREYLPPSILKFLVRIKAVLCRLLFPIPYAIFKLIPIKDNKIIFDNYRGRGYGCNPKYVAQELIKCGIASKCDLVWVVSRKEMNQSELPSQIRAVRYGSLISLYEYATAKIWVSNYHKIFYVRRGLRKRPGQWFIQMWHGSLGIKKIENSVGSLTQSKKWLEAAVISSKMTDYWISNSDFETNIYKTAFWNVTDDSILRFGHPRNDMFFIADEMTKARQKVVSAFDLGGKKILLYAPTFRENHRIECYELDFANLVQHMKQQFGGEWVILVRLHPRVKHMSSSIVRQGVVDATQYTDIQELLAAADCLITDYSSCAFDFILSRRPVFLFATDIYEYNQERGFYYPLSETPFQVARSNIELMENIDTFQQKHYLEKIDAFLLNKGCIEDGHASERVAVLIDQLMWQDSRKG